MSSSAIETMTPSLTRSSTGLFEQFSKTAAHDAGATATRHAFLFEAIICDVHWCALHIATIAMLMNVSAQSGDGRCLKPWSRIFDNDGDPALLALRYRAEIGLPAAVADKVASLYADFAAAKTASSRLVADGASSGPPRQSELAHASGDWRRLARDAAQLIEVLAPFVQRRLSGSYGTDAATLAGFLTEAADGETGRVNPAGEIALPALIQRRRPPRTEDERFADPERLLPALNGGEDA